MKFFLKLRHWQLFLITFSLPLLFKVYAIWDVNVFLRVLPFIMFVYLAATIGWIWSIGQVLYSKRDSKSPAGLVGFNACIIIPIIYISVILSSYSYAVYAGANGSGYAVGFSFLPGVVIGFQLVIAVMIIFAMRFAAKVLKSAEMGTEAKIGDYAGELFLIWFMPVGLWILQPRLNRLVGLRR